MRKGGRNRRKRDYDEEEERVVKRGKEEASGSGDDEEEEEEAEEEEYVEPLWTGEGEPLHGEAWTEEEDARVSVGKGWHYVWVC